MSAEEEEAAAAAAALAMMKEDAGGSGAEADQDVQVHGNMQRVKVYCLTNDGQWDDQGTGHITIDYIEGSKEIALAVVDEVDNDTLLLHHITSDNIYKKQDKTIISWKDPEKELDLLLSFQEAEGCGYIWQNINYLQQKLQSGDLGYGLKDLPSLELSSLPLLLKTVLEWGTKDGTRVAELISQNQDEFFPKLVDLFRTCEGSRNMDDLHMIFRLVKGIISLNNPDIFHKIFSDDFILDIIGALEYDPEVPNVQSHREFVQNQALNEAIHIGNVSVASKIRQTYIIGYIKDVILLNALDGPTVSSLNSIIEWNKPFVVSVLKDDASFIQDLIARITSSNTSAESKSKLVLFLRELCILSKSLEPKGQSQLSRDLIDEGAFNIISDVLQSQDKELFSAGANILVYFVDLHPDLVRTFIANHEENYLEGNSLLEFLVQGMIIDSAEEMLYQSCLKILLGSSDTTTNHQDVVLQVFFDKHIQKLIDVIASSYAPKGIARSTSGSAGVRTMVEQHSAKPETLLKICELLSFCALHHTNRMKIFFATNAMEKILTLTHRREKVLVVAAVQFVRTIIGRKDDFLVDRVIKLNLLKPVIKAFDENGDRDNMLQSVILELLEYIRKENLEPLIEYVAESFWDQLVKFERLQSIQSFKLKYLLMSIKSDVPEKIVESAETKQSTGVVDTRKKADERGADKEQEGYFNKDSDRVDSSTPTMHSQEQSIPARKPVNADEAQVVGNNPDGGRHSPHKKLKSVASASPSRSAKSSEGSGEGDGSRGS
ncbi:unnamed protein product [Miscanthus lutarioriparius]|uniref:Serine/threonine-protein phosphatase 4 regulatory subunit 3-like central domain-containing protein n=1 Tax=Miscanthus lutarioriparius TaxID=422564 RepID=A0A811RZL1_9POAL|nr:unnamed protein product [Miscanthus lutarioriparius]